MINPLTAAPADIPGPVITASLILAVFVLPVLFGGVCLAMRLGKVPDAPYFAYFSAFGSLGALCLGIGLANSPVSALGCYRAFLVSPFLLIRNFIRLRAQPQRMHRAAAWVSFFALTVIVSLLIWTVIDQYGSAAVR